MDLNARRSHIVAAALVILAQAGAARAEEPKPPPSARQLGDPPQLALPRAHLLGDWLGARTLLEDRGITPTVTFVTDALGNPSGGAQHGFTATNNLGVDALFDLQKLVGLAGGSFEASFSFRFGSSLTQEYIGNTFSVQQIFPGTYRLVQLAYRQQLFNDRLELRLGRFAAGDDFMVSAYSCVFVQNGFCGNQLPGDTGMIGNYKAGFWYDHSEYTDYTTVATGQVTSVSRGNWGIYGQFDQVLVQFGGPGSIRGFGITGSILASPDQSVSQIPIFANAALAIRGIFPSQPMDVGGLGVVYGHFSSDLQDSQQRAGQPVQDHEIALELTYRFRFLDDALLFQPDAQYIIQPGGTGQISDAFVAGLQAGVNL